ncbi:sugar transferase [Kytococcus sedentarius]|uniref:sugar transferase n=1 Tax=Kytococcus sedentarius TaxID=1276 RepID=UPI0038795B11
MTGLTSRQAAVKRAFDLTVSSIGLVAAAPVIVTATAVATVDTREWGIFSQRRIGRHGEPFTVHKIRTMRSTTTPGTTVTASTDPRITRSGAFMRRTKIDELPQLWDVLRGAMSFVGPRPDVPGFADRLEGEDRLLLSIRPGITSPGTLAFRNEEEILAEQDDPERYNREVLWPEKVRINLEYIRNWSLLKDVQCILQTVRPGR